MVSRRSRTPGVVAAFAALVLVGRSSSAQVPAAHAPIDLPCAAECQKEYDRAAGIAEGLVQRKGYSYSASSTNCSTAWDSTRYQCAVDHEVCASRCALSDAACKSPCRAAFQACCHSTALGNAAHYRAECLKGCRRMQRADAAVQLDSTPPETVARAQEAMESLRTEAEKASDEANRQKAFAEAAATLAKMKGKFALVIGGAGRLWIVKPDGSAVLLSRASRDLLRRGSALDEDKAVESLLGQGELGLSPDDVRKIVSTVARWPYRRNFAVDFKAGEALYFPGGEGWPKEVSTDSASSEHASIRGTINGGGDFI